MRLGGGLPQIVAIALISILGMARAPGRAPRHNSRAIVETRANPARQKPRRTGKSEQARFRICSESELIKGVGLARGEKRLHSGSAKVLARLYLHASRSLDPACRTHHLRMTKCGVDVRPRDLAGRKGHSLFQEIPDIDMAGLSLGYFYIPNNELFVVLCDSL
jgi:hypothetical protein